MSEKFFGVFGEDCSRPIIYRSWGGCRSRQKIFSECRQWPNNELNGKDNT